MDHQSSMCRSHIRYTWMIDFDAVVDAYLHKISSHTYLINDQNSLPRVMIDGPYGAPTQDYKDYDVVLLVGLGIGATPMISVVKDIVNNMKANEEEENSLEDGTSPSQNGTPLTALPKRKGGPGSGRHNFKTRRAYFYWVTREQGSFDWFKGVMNEVAENDHKGVIEMHNYCTSVYEEGDARSALITMLQSLNHAKNGVDVVSGTRVMSHFAKPNWRTVYKRIALNHPNSRVGKLLKLVMQSRIFNQDLIFEVCN